MADRFLIVNADDLGLSTAVNEGIFEAHERGIVTSASLMVLRPAAEAAAETLAEHPDLAVGLHLDVSRRNDAAFVLCRPEGDKGRTPERVTVAEDCWRQLERFRELVGRGPTHLDSHKHAHEAEPVTAVAEALAEELGVPLRGRAVRYEGRFYGRTADGAPASEAIAPDRMIELVRNLLPGWTEIGCHPAAGPVPTSSYDFERQLELRTLCDPRVREALNVSDVHLCSFAQVSRR